MSASGEAPQERELVLCHGCDNEWWRNEHGLECPRCECEIVEIVRHRPFPALLDTSDEVWSQINPHDDPRDDYVDSARGPSGSSNNDNVLPHHPLHNHDPWQHDPPDPDEEDIDRVAFSPAPGVHFERTYIRPSGRRADQGGTNSNEDVIGSLFQALGGLLQGANNPNHPGGPPHARAMVFTTGPHATPQDYFPSHQHHQHHHRHQNSIRSAWSPDSEGTGRNTYTAEARIFPQDMPGHTGHPLNNLRAVMEVFLAGMQGNMRESAPEHPRQNGPDAGGGAVFSLPDLFRQAFDPSNAVHGDAVFTQEAFDRIIGQMMDQNGASSAPGPASAAAIAALPKKLVDKSMMGADGKVECSVCMDAVDVGDEVTVLPCKHWFHEQCVGIWLKEHDTCPHCRQGIMSAGGDSNTSRQPNQQPSHSQASLDPPPRLPDLQYPTTQGPFTQPGMQHPYVPGGYPTYPEPQQFVQPPPQPHGSPSSAQQGPTRPLDSSYSSRSQPRRDSSTSGSARSRGYPGGEVASNAGSGMTGWFRSLRRGSRSSES